MMRQGENPSSKVTVMTRPNIGLNGANALARNSLVSIAQAPRSRCCGDGEIAQPVLGRYLLFSGCHATVFQGPFRRLVLLMECRWAQRAPLQSIRGVRIVRQPSPATKFPAQIRPPIMAPTPFPKRKLVGIMTTPEQEAFLNSHLEKFFEKVKTGIHGKSTQYVRQHVLPTWMREYATEGGRFDGEKVRYSPESGEFRVLDNRPAAFVEMVYRP